MTGFTWGRGRVVGETREMPSLEEKTDFIRGTDMAERKLNPLPETITYPLTHKFIKFPYKVPPRGVLLGYPDRNPFADFM